MIHNGKVIWMTGLSGSGKSTIAGVLFEMMFAEDYMTTILDGDIIRKGLCSDLGFSVDDRKENIRRLAWVSNLFSINGFNVITAFISPIEEDRKTASDIIGEENFIEVFVDCPLEICEQRDPKGLYKKVREGKIPNFTGIDSPYEAPVNPAVTVNTDKMDVFECAREIFKALES